MKIGTVKVFQKAKILFFFSRYYVVCERVQLRRIANTTNAKGVR